MQAIETRYIGATDFRQSRIKAICEAGSVTVHFDDNKNGLEGAHDNAARALILKLGWNDGRGYWVRGCTPKSRGYVYVLVPRSHSERLDLGIAPSKPQPKWEGYRRTLQRDGKPIASLNIYIGPEECPAPGVKGKPTRTVDPVEADELSKRIAQLLTEHGQ